MARTYIVGENGAEIIGPLTVTLAVRPKWWMRPALWASGLALHFGLIRAKPSAAHWGGIITAEERVARWLADYAFHFEVR